MKKERMCVLLIGITVCAQLAWASQSNPRYASHYVSGFQMMDESTRRVRCIPCDENRSNSIDEYRGNGADNLGYDWSPKAWGGLAFPQRMKGFDSQSDWTRERDGRKMADNWNDRENCRGCIAGWSRPDENYQDRPRDWDDRNRWSDRQPNRQGGWSSSTSKDWSRPTETPDFESTVTSTVLGVMYRNDKRLPVDWSGEEDRNMRWDGFRNGIPWDSSVKMDRRSSWDGQEPQGGDRDYPWNDSGKGHYASRWSYSSRPSQEWSGSGSKWNTERPWTHHSEKDHRLPDDRSYGSSSGSSLPFGSSYPNSNRIPPSYGYTSERPYGSNSFPSTSSPNQYHYPSSTYPSNNRPSYIPESNTRRPYPDNRPSYPSTPSHSYPDRPIQGESYRPQDNAPWNYQPDRYNTNRPNQWTTPRPSQNYLPQTGRPITRPGSDYGAEQRPNRPYGGTPSITIWNSGPNDYQSKPGPSGSKPPKGQYTGFITEIHGSNQNGIQYPNERPYDRPSSSSGYPPNNDRFPGGSTYPSNERYPDQPQRPNYESDRYPDRGNGYSDRFPNGRPDYNRPTSGSSYPNQGSDNRYPPYNTGNDRYPNNDRDRYPNQDKDRYPSYDRDRYPSYDSNRYPSKPNNNYPDRPSNSDRYPERPGNNDGDRYPERPDRYPSRPGASDHGPNPNSDSGSWNYGDDNKDGTYRRSGGSYPPYKGGHYFTSSYLASASTPASQEVDGKKQTDETTATSTVE